MKAIFRACVVFVFSLLAAGAAFAQFPASPNKIRLGNQTTGDGLLFRTAGAPGYTPTGVNNAWTALDTVTGTIYYYQGGTWNAIASGGADIDSLVYASDTLYLYTPSETFKVEILAGSATPDSLSYTATTQALSIVGSNTVSLLVNTDATLLGSNTDAQKLRVDTSIVASKLWIANNVRDTAAKLTVTNVLGPIKLSAGLDTVNFDDGNGTNATFNSGALRFNLNAVGTAGTYTSVTTDLYGRVTGGTNPGFVTVVDSTRLRQPLDSVIVYYQNGVEVRRDTIRTPGGGGGGGSGTVTSVAAGNGITASPSPITTTGTISADTAVLVSKVWANNALALKLNIADTTTMLAPYLLGFGTSGRIPRYTGTRTFAAGTLGDDGTRVSMDDASTSTAKPFRLDSWTTAARPGTPSTGDVGWNTTNGNLDIYGAAAWENFAKSANATGLGTAGRIFYADANGRSATGDISWNNTSGLLGINIASPTNTVHIRPIPSGTQATFRVESYGNQAGDGGEYLFARAKGTPAAPTTLNTTSDRIFRIMAQGYDGSAMRTGADITAFIDGSVTSGNTPMRLSFGTVPAGGGTTVIERLRITSTGLIGIRQSAPLQALHVSGKVQIDTLTDTAASLAGFTGTTGTGVATRVTIGSGLTLTSGTLTASSGVSDGDKGDIDVTSSGAVWTVDTNAITTVKINDAAVTEAKLANGAAGGAKLGGLTYISADDVNVDLTNYLSTNWLSVYSQLVVWLRIGNTAIRTVTFPTPSSTYQGKVVEIFFGATNGATHFGQMTTATNRFTYRDGDNVATATTYDGGGTMKYARVICSQDPNTLAYQWLIMDVRY